MSKSRCLLALVFLGSITLAPVTSWANASICDAVAGNLVMNCGFETGDFSHWTVTNAASRSFIAVINNPPLVHSGNFVAEFGALGTTDDSISQVLSTTASRSFDLSFFVMSAGDTFPRDADFSASWDGFRIFSAPVPKLGFPYAKFSFVVPGHGIDQLRFAGRNVESFYYLDDVVVTPVVVTEPSTLCLFGVGLLFVGTLLRRKGAQA